ncbi:lysoplasmalogenase [Rhizobium sp. KAs_5_22]|uniref:lysoplasmalogenase n=1 Tax=Ciceribacter selenitireducens TaxID=448181 RepID=UPI00048E0587|nr:lysoplasmalogenase [Ciceribacter selenitireducens]PPJ45373.1 lysoplasmalogenase [Rhizobium sp. KAs_5_22]
MEIFATIVLALAVLIGLSYFAILPKPASPRRALWKTLPVSLLALYALLMEAPDLMVLGLALSALGDAFLAYEGEKNFMGGLSSFLLAHIAYGALFYEIGDLRILTGEAWRLSAAGLSVALAVLLVAYLWRPAGRLAPAVLAYATAIAAMAILSLSVPPIAVFVGAALFLSSDAVLAVETFRMEKSHPMRRLAALYVWASYFAAQVVLTLAVVAFAS